VSHPDLQLAALVADELTDDERRAVERHAGLCGRCATVLDELRRATAALAVGEPRLELPPLVRRARTGSNFGAMPALGVAAALLVGVALGAFLRDQRLALAPAAASVSVSPLPTLTGPRASVTTSPSVTPRATASALPSPTSSAPAAAATCSFHRDGATGASLQACSGAGAVGATVTLEGRGCSAPGADPTIVFGTSYDADGRPEAAVGWVQLPPISVAADGSFRVEFIIPAQLGSRQGAGGGPTTPGRYQFFSKPAVCSVTFTVLGP